MIEKLTNFDEIEAYKDESGLGFKEALIGYFTNLGENLGFTTRANFSVIRHGVGLGKADLIWVEPNIIFFTEFGNFDEILKPLWKTVELEPALSVLILSSNSSCSPSQVKTLIDKSKVLKDIRKRFLILDISKKEYLKL